MIDRTYHEHHAQPDSVEEALRLRRASVDTNAKRAASTAPPMRETHVEVRRRILERAHAARVAAENEYRAARDQYDALFPKPDARSEAVMETIESIPPAQVEWKIGDHALRSEKLQAADTHARAGRALHTEMPHLDFADRALDTQVGGAHYKSMAIQPVEFIDKNKIPYLEGNAIKYICRHADKGGVQDIDKAIHYLQLLKELRYGTAK